MTILALNQVERADLGYVRPRFLVDIALSGFTLRVSTVLHPYTYTGGSLIYEPYLLSIDGLSETVDFEQVVNPSVTLTLLNKRWGNYQYLSQLNSERVFSRADVTIYETRSVNDDRETFANVDAGRTVLAKLSVDHIKNIDLESGTFQLQLCSRLHSLRNSIGLNRVSAKIFPSADKNDIGKYRNIPFGSMEYLPCRLIKTGAMDTLFSDLTATSSSVIVSGVAQLPWAPGVNIIQIDDEQIWYTGYDVPSKTFWGLWRPSPVPHSKGATVYQVMTEIVYEVAGVPIDAITDVLVDNIRQPIDSKCQVFTGRGASQLPGYNDTAVVKFTVQPVVKKQVNVEVSAEHAHTTAEGTHGHAFSGGEVITKIGTGYIVGGQVDNPAYAYDGDEGTSARLYVAQGSSSGESFLGINLSNNANLGVITGIMVKVCFGVSIVDSNTGTFNIRYGGYTVASFSKGASLGKGWRTYWVSPAAGWAGRLDFDVDSLPSYPVTAFIYDCRVEITCSPVLANSPASGVATARSGSTVLGGESVADVVIGKEVVVHCRGVLDDAAGTATGTPNALVQRADHVFRWFLCVKCKIPVGDIGASFTTSGNYYQAFGYNLAFVLHDIGTDLQRVLSDLAKEVRSIFYEWGGKFELKWLPTFAPGAADFVINRRDVKGGPRYSYGELADAANKVVLLYRKDLRANKDYGSATVGVVNADAQAAGFIGYMEDSFGSADLDEQITLKAIRTDVPAADYLMYQKIRRRKEPVNIALTMSYRAINAAPGMVFEFDDPVFGAGSKYLLMRFNPRQSDGVVDIEGLLMVPWLIDDASTESTIDNVVAIQTHLVLINDSASDTEAEVLGCLNWAVLAEANTETVADNIDISQTHIMVISDSSTETVLDEFPLGLAWEPDIVGFDIMPTTGTISSTGWFGADASLDLQPNESLVGSDTIWETDGSGDLMPK